MNGLIWDPLESEERKTVINLFANHLSLNRSAELQADHMFLQANETIKLHGKSKLTSTVSNECETTPLRNTDLYECISSEFDYPEFSLMDLLNYYNKQYPLDTPKATNIVDFRARINKKWNVYLMS